MIRIEVQSQDVQTRTIRGKKGDFQVSEQDAWAFLYDEQGNEHPYPTRITVRLGENQPGYSHGKYFLSPQSVYVKDRFGNLAIGRPVLVAEEDYRAQFSA